MDNDRPGWYVMMPSECHFKCIQLQQSTGQSCAIPEERKVLSEVVRWYLAHGLS